eukprot:TRINITY_DN60539_c0_g1_i1.p1 TRINITY_DN60539_c0_g1~~TRINITY_DN60539_c0_g1_i1.p1  ORF type:complete len:505 (+),score=109.45 TRINITY_DN60539_c0_g1_i1:59-1573(+)
MTVSSTDAELTQSGYAMEEEDSASRNALAIDAPDLEALQEKIMVQIQHKLSQKEESLWRRGQVEIKRLQTQQKEVTATLSMMQERQETLVKENQKMRGALMEVTTKFEQVVKQMREVLRALPQAQQAQLQQEQARPSPSPSEASTAASGEAPREEQVASREEPTPASGLQASSVGWFAGSSQCGIDTPISMWHGSRGMSACGEESAVLPVLGASSSDSEAKYFSTPPRVAAAMPAAEDFLAQTLPIPGSWGSAAAPSPAVLSLASAIPSSAAAAPVTPSPSPGAQRLHLAEWLPEPKQEVLMPTPPLPTRQSEASSVASATATACALSQHSVKIELNKEPGFTTLGIEVNQDDGSLKVEHIDEHGFVGHYNTALGGAENQANRVLIGDRIVEVNGIRDAPNRMLHECKVSQRLVVTLERKSEACGVTEAEEQTVFSSSTKLRPDAQVFVPSAQKAPQVSSAEAVPAPPGLEQVSSAVPSHVGDTDSAVPVAADEIPETRRALFH